MCDQDSRYFLFRMNDDAEKIINSRGRRSANDLDFLSESLDKILRSQIENQDEVLKHQTDLIQKLVNGRNDTAVLDQHYFNLVREIRVGYNAVRQGLESKMLIPNCPEATTTLLFLSAGLAVSLLINLIVLFATVKRTYKRLVYCYIVIAPLV